MHTIRLRGPWRFRFVASAPAIEHSGLHSDDAELPLGTVPFPADWRSRMDPALTGFVESSRRFGAPSGLTEHDEIQLAIDAPRSVAGVWFNGVRLGDPPATAQTVRYPVRQLLAPRNLLVITFRLDALPPVGQPDAALNTRPNAPFEDVRLEIGPPEG